MSFPSRKHLKQHELAMDRAMFMLGVPQEDLPRLAAGLGATKDRLTNVEARIACDILQGKEWADEAEFSEYLSDLFDLYGGTEWLMSLRGI